MKKCKDGCTYSRSLMQPFPRKCVKCGKEEKVSKAVTKREQAKKNKWLGAIGGK